MSQSTGEIWIGTISFTGAIVSRTQLDKVKFYGDLAQRESGTIALSSAPEVIGYANDNEDGPASRVWKQNLNRADLKSLPFDSKRMVYGGFKVLVDA